MNINQSKIKIFNDFFYKICYNNYKAKCCNRYMVKKTMDEIRYVHKDENNILTIGKKLR